MFVLYYIRPIYDYYFRYRYAADSYMFLLGRNLIVEGNHDFATPGSVTSYLWSRVIKGDRLRMKVAEEMPPLRIWYFRMLTKIPRY